MKDRPHLANGYKVTSPDGKVSYLFGTAHLLYKVPKELQTLIEQKKIQHIYIENDTIKKNTKVPKIIGLDQGISLMGRTKGIPVTKLDCLPGNNLAKIQVTVSRFKKNDLKAYFTPQIIVDQIKDYYIGPDLKDNPYFIKNYGAIITMKNYANDLVEVNQRNQLWKSTVLQALQKGNALIAVGINHIIARDGYIDILKKENFTFMPYECTIDINHEEVKKVINLFTGPPALMKEAKEAEKCHATGLKQQLSVLVKAYHTNTLSLLQNSELCRILKFILENDTSDVFFENSLLLFLLKKDSRDCSIDSLLEYRLSSTIELKKIEVYIQSLFKMTVTPQILGEQRQAVFLACLFYPALAKKLYHDFKKIRDTPTTDLFILCGFAEHEKTTPCETKAHDKSILSSTIIDTPLQPKIIKKDETAALSLEDTISSTLQEYEYQPLAGGPASKMGLSKLVRFLLINKKGLHHPLLVAPNDDGVFEPLINRKKYKS